MTGIAARVGWMALALVVTLLAAAHAQPAGDGHEPLPPLAGVRIGKIHFVRSEKERDPALERAIASELGTLKGQDVGYLYNFVSLDDRKPAQQALVVMHGANVCGTGGCPGYVFSRTPKGYKRVVSLTLVHTPVVVLPERHHGWHSLALVVSGGGVKAHYVRLDFDGRTYPSNPSVVAPLKPGTTVSGTAYVADPLGPDSGVRMRLP